MTRSYHLGPLDFRSISPTLRGLMIAHAAGFLLAHIVPSFGDMFGLVPAHLLRERWLWQPFTYLFIQWSFVGLLLTVLGLWWFGAPIEAQWGSREFLKYYFLCGSGAGLVRVALEPLNEMASLGPAPADFGLLVAFAMLLPDDVVYLYFLFPVKARYVALIYGLLAFFLGGAGAPTRLGTIAALSGMAIGYVHIRWWWVLKTRAMAFLGQMVESWRARRERPPAPRRAGARRPGGAPVPPSGDEEVDRILDKISAYGTQSLSEAERELLRRASERRKPQGHA